MKYSVRLACFALFLFSALYPITGSTIMNSDDVRARLVFEAYRRAFPDRITAIEFVNNDWTAVADGLRFYWARGTILPEKDRSHWASFRQHGFYAYPDEVRDPRSYSPERVIALRRQGDAETRLNGADHHPAFRAALYGGATRAGAEKNLVTAQLFGRTVSVHRRIAEAVERVHAAVAEAAKADAETAAFLAGIGSVGGYNWREIRGTARRSYHSWGLAIDVQPRRLENKATFWEWERNRNEDWMLVPLERRWMPPRAVIAAFEREGFTWGGKWDFYDTMHFEYRPELHEMKRVFAALENPDAEFLKPKTLFGVGDGDREPAGR